MMRSILVFAFTTILAVSGNSQVVINEICATNGDINYDPQYYNFPGWIELYNAGSAEVNLGNFNLSDDPANKTKWKIPFNTKIAAKGYLLIWCDDMATGLHSNFNLDADGETIIFSNASQVTLDQITFPEQYINVSYGRISNGAPTWSYLNTPTPALANAGQSVTDQLDAPIFSVAAGRYTGTQQVTLSHTVAGTEIRYTTDGAEPLATSTLYTQPVSISSTSTLKAKAFHSNYIASDAKTATYFINEHAFTLPIVSVSTKPAYLFDNIIGIYADGTNGIAGNCQNTPMNWNQDWDRHAVFEYFLANGVKEFDQHIDIRIGGACSRNNPQKSLVIKARGKFGDNTIKYEMFSTKTNDSFGGFMLRNSGNDFWYTMFRDALLQQLPLGQMDIDYMAYQPSTVYLNGAYWGIMNIREKIDADYIESNYGIKKDDVDLLETGGNPIEGDAIAYNTFLNNLQQMDPSDPQTFQYIDQNIDVQEYINYLTAEIYYANTDWPGNNTKFWRQRSTNGKFRWILWDTDFGFGLYSNNSWPTHPTFNFATEQFNQNWPNPAWSTLLIRLVLQTPEFRTRFIQTFTTAMGTTFKPERVNNMINEFQSRISSEIVYHSPRWGHSLDNWNNSVQQMQNFASERNAFMWGHTATFFGLNGTLGNIKVTGTPALATGFDINGVYSDATETETPYFNGLAYTISAKPKPGYKFKEWKITKQDATAIPLINQGSTWRYFDQGSKPATDWMNTNYTDASWAEGTAQLGYGGDGEVTTVSYGSNASNKYITTYFRKSFNVGSTTNLQDIQAGVLFDDGVVVYLNGQEVYRNNLPVGTIDYNTLAPTAINPERTFFPFTISKDLLLTGTNVIAIEVHQTNATSSDLTFDFSMNTVEVGNSTVSTSTNITQQDLAFGNIILEATFEEADPVTGLIINEIASSNSSYTDAYNESDDWIELYNAGNKTIDLSGLYITDDLSNKTKHQFKAGSNNEMKLNPGAYLIVWVDEQPTQGASHVGFKLSADGESVGLYQKVGENMVTLNEVTFGVSQTNTSNSRIPNATGPFKLTAVTTPGAANQDADIAVITGLVINEINSANTTHQDPFGEYDDWIELYNSGTTAVDLTGLFITDKLNNKLKHELQSESATEMILNPGEYHVLWADEQTLQGSSHLSFKLSADGEAVGLYQRIGEQVMILDEVTFGVAETNTSFSRIPNGTGPITITATITPDSENIFGEVVGIEDNDLFPVTLYPNPSQGIIRIKTEQVIDRITIYNSKGQVCKLLLSPDEEGEILLPEQSGLYLIQLQSNQGSKIIKVIRE